MKGKGKALQQNDMLPAPQGLTTTQLADPKTTKAEIISYATFSFRAKLAASKTKGELI